MIQGCNRDIVSRLDPAKMSSVPPAAIVNAQNAQKKHFLGMPAPLGYVAGVGRGATGTSVNTTKRNSECRNQLEV